MRTRLPLALTCALSLSVPLAAGAVAPAAAVPAPAAVVVASVSTSADDDALVARLKGAANSQYLRGYLTGMVVDPESGETIWSHNAARTRMPASTQKVLTAFTVLDTIDPAEQLVTTARQSTTHPGNVYLKGAGDPSLTASKLGTLAARTAAALKAQKRTSVKLFVDASVFPAPSNATGWKASYVPREVQPVRGLTLAGYNGADNDLAAGRAFRRALTANGIKVTAFGRGAAPSGSRQLSESWSSPVGDLVATTLRVSHNTYAEYLLRLAAKEKGLRPTWANALSTQRRALAARDIPTKGLVNADGSGLSRSNRMPAATLAAAVEKMYEDPEMNAVAFAYDGMPRSGQTGTLRTRYAAASQRCARGSVWAKTGTLNDVVALAGVARDTSGRDRVFVLMENGRRDTAKVRVAIDQFATVLVGCN